MAAYTVEMVDHRSNEPTERCSLCERDVPRRLITLHHLTPKSRGGTAEQRVPLCKPCHKQIHATFDNKTLERELAQVEQLRAHPQLQPFLKWIAKQSPDRNFRVVTSNDHPKRRRRR